MGLYFKEPSMSDKASGANGAWVYTNADGVTRTISTDPYFDPTSFSAGNTSSGSTAGSNGVYGLGSSFVSNYNQAAWNPSSSNYAVWKSAYDAVPVPEYKQYTPETWGDEQKQEVRSETQKEAAAGIAKNRRALERGLALLSNAGQTPQGKNTARGLLSGYGESNEGALSSARKYAYGTVRDAMNTENANTLASINLYNQGLASNYAAKMAALRGLG